MLTREQLVQKLLVSYKKGQGVKRNAFFVLATIACYFYTSDWSTFERGVAAGFIWTIYAIYYLAKELEATNERLSKALGSRYD